ncbi:hypothetical protein QAD02_012392 [Eretmocerus hayati]|uniref:Uncharacterized protein n=1 Tax=Eretmocerus hayati TaxID=131215 RepID=A0ACC2P4A1_9HYME|nr:hypothetical protein QAD02_012392 [Eretmocerus hayati]
MQSTENRLQVVQARSRDWDRIRHGAQCNVKSEFRSRYGSDNRNVTPISATWAQQVKSRLPYIHSKRDHTCQSYCLAALETHWAPLVDRGNITVTGTAILQCRLRYPCVYGRKRVGFLPEAVPCAVWLTTNMCSTVRDVRKRSKRRQVRPYSLCRSDIIATHHVLVRPASQTRIRAISPSRRSSRKRRRGL